MNKCLKITLQGELPKGFLHEVIQKHAKKLSLEGTVTVEQVNGRKVRVIACGVKDAVDLFLDMLHKSLVKVELRDIEIEPFLKDKDYRGVFRVIE